MRGEPVARYPSDSPHASRTTGDFTRPAYTLEQVRTFLAVARGEHMTQAARTLRLSKSAVTHQIQVLERALGIELLERVGRNIRLTRAGMEVAAAGQLIMRALDNLENVVQSVRDLHRGAVSVGASQLAATYFLPPVIADFTRVHPQINLAVVVAPSHDLCRRVAGGDLDCALVDGMPPPMTNLRQTWVAATEVVIVAHPSRAGWTASEHVVPPCCHVAWAPSSTGEAATAPSGDGVDLSQRLRLNCMETARRLVRGSPDFVAAMPLIGVREDLASGTLARLGPRSEPLPVFAVRREGSDNPAREALWRLLIRKPVEAGTVEA